MSAPLKLHFDQATLDKVEAFHESIKDRALEVVQKVLPAKVRAAAFFLSLPPLFLRFLSLLCLVVA